MGTHPALCLRLHLLPKNIKYQLREGRVDQGELRFQRVPGTNPDSIIYEL